MRFDRPYTLKKTEVDVDVLLVDTVGVAFNWSYVSSQGMGGSEFQAVMLLEELAKLGYKCACINRGPFASISPNGVQYFPIADLEQGIIAPRAKALIGMRTSVLPDGIEFQRAFFWIHDIPDKRIRIVHDYLAQMSDAVAICVSNWQREQCPPGWDKCSVVLPNMIPDWVYDAKVSNPKREAFIYASAAMKGLDATLDVWRTLTKQYGFKKERLDVLSPGYDKPKDDIGSVRGVSFLGSKPFAEVVERIGNAKALLYVNTFPETFGIVPVLAQIVGTPTLILCVNGVGALGEVMGHNPHENPDTFGKIVLQGDYISPAKPKDYRASKIIQQWVDLLGLKQNEVAA